MLVAQKVDGSDNKWVVTDTDSNSQYVVFCNASNNTEQGAIDALSSAMNGSD